MSKQYTKPGAKSDEEVSVELDIKTINKIEQLISEYTPRHPYTANVLKRIQMELHDREKQFHAPSTPTGGEK